jgi:hypothetical protein
MEVSVNHHAALRAKQRYQYDLTPDDKLWMLAIIRLGLCKKKKYHVASGRWRCTFEYAGDIWDVVVDKDITELITFLPNRNGKRKARN